MNEEDEGRGPREERTDIGSGNPYDLELGWHEMNMRLGLLCKSSSTFDETIERIIREMQTNKKGIWA